jgi:Fe2+ or Zn2+ uptake regulation protein
MRIRPAPERLFKTLLIMRISSGTGVFLKELRSPCGMVESRSTRQKRILNDAIASFSSLFSAEALHTKALELDAKISLATVYRHLKRREADHSLYSYQCEGHKVYSTRSRTHCHYTCTDTGQQFHFDLPSLSFLTEHVPGTIESVQIEVTGRCNTSCGACGK